MSVMPWRRQLGSFLGILSSRHGLMSVTKIGDLIQLPSGGVDAFYSRASGGVWLVVASLLGKGL